MKTIDDLLEHTWFFLVLVIGASGLYLSVEIFLSGLLQEALTVLILISTVYGFVRHAQLKNERGVKNENR